MSCNRLQLIHVYKYCIFSLLAQILFFFTLLDSTPPSQTSNLHNFLVSCPNHFKQSSNFNFLILYKPHWSEFAETSSNGKTFKEEKMIILHPHRCKPTPPRHIRWPTSTTSSFFFFSKVIDPIFFGWPTSKVVFPILKSCHSQS